MLTVVSAPQTAGTVEVSPSKAKYESYDSIMLTAIPWAGYVFDSWTGEISDLTDPKKNPVVFVMGDNLDNNRVITANFMPSDLRYTVTASSEPSGGGSAEFLPPQAPGGYLVNESVTVFAVAQTGYVFSRWAGDLAGTDNCRTIIISENRSITAIFYPTITTYWSPSEGGSVLVQPESFSGYAAGTVVTISAEAAKGYHFVSWEGDASGSDRSITITVDAPKIMTAKFVGQTPSRWWLWAILGLTGLTGVLIILRLAYARMNRGALDEPKQRDE